MKQRCEKRGCSDPTVEEIIETIVEVSAIK